jgi:carbon-monoxide dehydrogenase medium subunit
VPLKDFFTGVKKSVLKPDEIVEAIVVPPDTAGARGSYSKLKRIEGHDLSLVGVAVARNDGVVRVSIGSAAPTPLLLDGLRADLPVEEVVSAVKHVVRPISDLRSSKEYREFMIEVFVRRLFQEVQ